MADVLLLSDSDFKQLVPVNSNLNGQTPLPQSILTAQLQWVKKVIGEKYYDDLQAKLVTNPITTTADDDTFLDKLKYPLAWYTYYEMMVFSFVRMREIGPAYLTGQNTTTPDLKSVEHARDNALSHGNNAMADFVRWAYENRADYPLFNLWYCSDDFYYAGQYWGKYPPNSELLTDLDFRNQSRFNSRMLYV